MVEGYTVAGVVLVPGVLGPGARSSWYRKTSPKLRPAPPARRRTFPSSLGLHKSVQPWTSCLAASANFLIREHLFGDPEHHRRDLLPQLLGASKVMGRGPAMASKRSQNTASSANSTFITSCGSSWVCLIRVSTFRA